MEKYKDMRAWTWSVQGKGDARFVAFRKEFVDALIEYALEKEQCKETCTVASVGSVSLASDYDLTVSGPRAANVVDRFNREFRAYFNNQESAIVFDTNVYGAGFLEPIQLGNFTQYGKFKYVADAGDAVRQREWALLKVYPEKHARETIRQRNEAYVEALYVVQDLKKQMKATMRPDYELRRRYKESISQANYYGSETYFTQGAFMHVVGQRQSNMSDIPITCAEYIDSFIENAGDALHKNGDVKYVARAIDALLKADIRSPFLERLYNAAELMRTRVRGKTTCGMTCEEIQARYTEVLAGRSIEDLLQSFLSKWRVVY